MEDVWGRGEHVQVMHPGTHCIAGHENVRCHLPIRKHINLQGMQSTRRTACTK